MSRGIGRTQRQALFSLWQARAERDSEAEERDTGIPLTALKHRISPDRANARRAIRNLIERGMVEEIREEGGRRVKLTSGGYGALTLASVLRDPGEDFTEGDIPSKPFDFNMLYREVKDLTEQEPHVPLETPCPYDASSESAISDNGIPQANEGPPYEGEAMPESPVNDNAISRALTWLEEQL